MDAGPFLEIDSLGATLRPAPASAAALAPSDMHPTEPTFTSVDAVARVCARYSRSLLFDKSSSTCDALGLIYSV